MHPQLKLFFSIPSFISKVFSGAVGAFVLDEQVGGQRLRIHSRFDHRLPSDLTKLTMELQMIFVVNSAIFSTWNLFHRNIRLLPSPFPRF
jgi:hypothetical protein